MCVFVFLEVCLGLCVCSSFHVCIAVMFATFGQLDYLVIFVCLCIYVSANLFECVSVCASVCEEVCVCLCVYVLIRVYMHLNVSVRVYV